MDSVSMKNSMSHPGGPPSTYNNKSLISEVGDIQKTSDKLMF